MIFSCLSSRTVRSKVLGLFIGLFMFACIQLAYRSRTSRHSPSEEKPPFHASNQESNKGEGPVDGGSLFQSIGLDRLRIDLLKEIEPKDFSALGFKERSLFKLKRSLDRISKPEERVEIELLVEELEHSLFPWILNKFKSIDELLSRSIGSGIAMPVGAGHFYFAMQAIKVIRQLGCILPIEIFYSGAGDLHAWQIDELKQLDKVKVVDITAVFDNSILQLRGWAIKPFCILASGFRQVLLVDADTIFLSNPGRIFNDPLFKSTGTLFYLDRTLFPNIDWQSKWLESFLPHPITERVKKTRYYRRKTAHEQDSAVVAIDKTIAYDALLTVCSMNNNDQREAMYKKVHGDKETFWLGFELIGVPVSFNPYPSAAIGTINTNKGSPQVCGKVLHFDEEGKPFWWNGALVFDKYSDEGMRKFFPVEGWSAEGAWQFETSCVFNSTVNQFTDSERYLFNDVYNRIWRSTLPFYDKLTNKQS